MTLSPQIDTKGEVLHKYYVVVMGPEAEAGRGGSPTQNFGGPNMAMKKKKQHKFLESRALSV
jgi:hypothetical protein